MAISRLQTAHRMLIGVHMRMTDFRYWNGGKHFVSQERYATAVNQLNERFKEEKPVFILCSDEPILEDLFKGVSWHRGPGDIAGDIEILARCDRMLCTESSFSGWSSFVGQVPRITFGENHVMVNESEAKVYAGTAS